MVAEGGAPALELVEDAPGRRHGNREDDQRVRERLFVEGELEEVHVAWVAVQDPYAEACVICQECQFIIMYVLTLQSANS